MKETKKDTKTINVSTRVHTKLKKFAAGYVGLKIEDAANTAIDNHVDVTEMPYRERIQHISGLVEDYVYRDLAAKPEWDNNTYRKWLRTKNKAISTYKKATELALQAAAIK